MTQTLAAVRGMNDLLPNQTPYWQFLEENLRQLASAYHYQEIRFPIIEQTALFKRSIGEATDIVEKEMYTFEDRNGDSLTLRPEGTAVCVRAGIQNGLLYNQQQRLWYLGPMFRHERPQKGRYRQFHQFGLEAFGMPGPDIDAEQLLMMARLWKALGISDTVKLQINSLGSNTARAIYREQLIQYFSQHNELLDEDSKRRLTTNPLRILDSKNPQMQSLIANAPSLLDYLDEDAKRHFDGLLNLLTASGIPYEINPRLVRGLDYYNNTVFEWVTDQLGAQNAICSGGRYDILVEQLGGKATPAVGLAMGLERIIALLEAKQSMQHSLDAYFVLLGEAAQAQGFLLAESLRNAVPGLALMVNCGGGNPSAQLKRADKSGARMAFILGENEIADGCVMVKYLREHKEQEKIAWTELAQFLRSHLSV